MPPSKRAPRKEDPIQASELSGLNPSALSRICAETAGGNPHFSHAISKFIPIESAFVSESRRSFGRDRNAFETAIHHGNLAYARLLAARLSHARQERKAAETAARAKKSQSASRAGRYDEDHDYGDWRHGRGELTAGHVKKEVFESSATDQRAWLCRGWIQERFGKGAAPTASDLAHEAHLAFAAGRPALAQRLCQALLALEPIQIAEATSLPAADLPFQALDTPVKLGAGGAVDAHEFRNAVQLARSGRHDESGSLTSNAIERVSLLSLGGFWVAKLAKLGSQEKSPAMSAEAKVLESTLDQLWERGACSSPSDSAQRFARAPYGNDAPQLAARKGLSRKDQSLAVHVLWREAAMNADKRVGDQNAWEAFVEAHAGFGEVQANPFALISCGQSPALWSLAGDCSLIQWGIDAGFDPRPTQSFLAEPGSTAHAARNKKRIEPTMGRAELDKHWEDGLRSPCFFIDKERSARSKSPTLGAAEPDHKNWRRTNLASLALFSGHRPVAEALCRAGCKAPDASIATAELGAMGEKQAVSQAMAAFEDFLLRESVSDPDAPAAKPSQSKKGAQAAPAPAPKRRILRV